MYYCCFIIALHCIVLLCSLFSDLCVCLFDVSPWSMHWWASPFPLPLCAELGFPPLNGLLWPLLLLFLWYCYRMGSDLPPPGRAHPGGKHKSGARRFMMLSRGAASGGPRETASGSEGSGVQQAPPPCISTQTSEDEDPDGREYLTPVPGRPLFPAQASAAGRKLYAALQEYAKRYGWVGMGRIHKALREQVGMALGLSPSGAEH